MMGMVSLWKKYLVAASLGEARTRVAWLIQWLCAGGGIPECMHGKVHLMLLNLWFTWLLNGMNTLGMHIGLQE